jgi:hypothetical protein
MFFVRSFSDFGTLLVSLDFLCDARRPCSIEEQAVIDISMTRKIDNEYKIKCANRSLYMYGHCPSLYDEIISALAADIGDSSSNLLPNWKYSILYCTE